MTSIEKNNITTSYSDQPCMFTRQRRAGRLLDIPYSPALATGCWIFKFFENTHKKKRRVIPPLLIIYIINCFYGSTTTKVICVLVQSSPPISYIKIAAHPPGSGE